MALAVQEILLCLLLYGLTPGLVVFIIWNRRLRRKVLQYQQLEARRWELEQQYKRLVATVPVGIFRSDAAQQTVYANGRCCQILGLSPEQMAGEGWQRSLHPDDRDRVLQAWSQAIQEDRPFELEYRCQRPDGSVVWVYGQCLPERDAQDQQQGYISTLTDISAFKRSEAALQKSEAHHRALVAAIPDLIMRINRAGFYLEFTASPNFRVLGNLQDWVGTHVARRLPPEIAQKRLHAIDQALRTGSVQIYEQTLTFDGQVQIEEVRVAPYNEDEVLLLVRDISDRKSVVNQLRQSERRFRHAIEVAPFPIMLHAEDGEVLQINSVWTELTGYNHADISRVQDWAERAYGNKAAEVMAEVITRKYSLNARWDEGEFTITTQDGDQRIWQFSSAPLDPLQDGRRVVMSMAADVTEHRQAELALIQSEQRFRNIAANVPGAILRYVLHPDQSAAVVYMSPGCSDLWEVEAEATMEDANIIWNMVHPDDLADMAASVTRSAQTLEPWVYQWRITTPSGQPKWLEAAGRPERQDNGDVVWDTLVLDVSARKQAETALWESEARFRLVTENMSDLVCLHHPDGRYLYVTPSSQALLGYCPEELIDQDPYQFFHPEDRDRIRKAAHQMALRGEPHPIVYRMRHKTGEYLWLETITQPIFDSEGQLLHLQTTSRDVSDRVKAEEQLKHDALHDSLTGLPNRTLLLERLDLALKRAKRHPDFQFAVLFLDLDHFKVINDSLGHSIGDALLLAVANQLKTFVRETDVAARLGGDEFVLLIEEIEGLTEAIAVAERLLEAFKSPLLLNGREVFTSTSIGILTRGTSHRTAEDLLRDADLAMYRAKQDGRGHYAIFDRTLHVQAMQRLQLDTELRRGLENDEFVLYYQPIVSLRTGSIQGFEALIRWQHPDHGLILPGKFIPTAEETRLIVPMGRWVLQTACAQMAAWRAQLPEQSLRVSINLSVQQLQPDLLEHLDEALGQSGLPGAQLVLEITESMLVQKLETTDSLLLQLKARGIHLSIDDFGTGYSSLSYLHRLPADALKIDRAFVSPNERDARNQAIAESIVTLSNLLELNAIAEGIETLEQLQWLQSLGCELGQGNWFSPPLSTDQATVFLNQARPQLTTGTSQ